jgi:glutaminase
MNLKKIEKVFMSKFVGTGPSSYEKRIYRAVVSQGLRNTGIEYLITTCCTLSIIVQQNATMLCTVCNISLNCSTGMDRTVSATFRDRER